MPGLWSYPPTRQKIAPDTMTDAACVVCGLGRRGRAVDSDGRCAFCSPTPMVWASSGSIVKRESKAAATLRAAARLANRGDAALLLDVAECRECGCEDRITLGVCAWCRADAAGRPWGTCPTCLGALAVDRTCACKPPRREQR